jgi:hypothetical protein
MNTRTPESSPDKTRCYEALAQFNRGFENLLESLRKLKDLNFLRPDLGRALHVALEETRAWTNFEVLEKLHQREQRDWARWGRLRTQWEKQYQDPDDLLREAARLRKMSARSDRGGRAETALRSTKSVREARRRV